MISHLNLQRSNDDGKRSSPKRQSRPGAGLGQVATGGLDEEVREIIIDADGKPKINTGKAASTTASEFCGRWRCRPRAEPAILLWRIHCDGLRSYCFWRLPRPTMPSSFRF